MSNIDNTVVETPIVQPQVEALVENKNKYSKRVFDMVGDPTCGGCIDAEHIINTKIKPNSDVETELKKVNIDTPEGQQIAKDNSMKVIPYVRECLIPTDPNEKPICTDYKKFRETDYKIKVNNNE